MLAGNVLRYLSTYEMNKFQLRAPCSLTKLTANWIDSIQIKSETNAMTGEWIIIHKHQGKNYYLAVAAHDEGDQNVYDRVVLACEVDNFPFHRRSV